MATWYTQPKKSFASYYYFDSDNNRTLVRIRLELNRKDGSGPKCLYDKNRYIGFSATEYRGPQRMQFTLENGVICDANKTKLSTAPTVGLRTYDFSSDNDKTPNGKPHKGNRVTDKQSLPKGLDEDMLKELAKKTIEAGKTIKLLVGDKVPTTEDQLMAAIKQVLGGEEKKDNKEKEKETVDV